mgnify:CR=1 FL=1
MTFLPAIDSRSCLIALVATGIMLPALPARPVEFAREIRPILSDACFKCHGVDAAKRKAKLRLDTFEGATTSGDLGGAIIPGNAGESELVHRIFTEDADELMPPPSSKRLSLIHISEPTRPERIGGGGVGG